MGIQSMVTATVLTAVCLLGAPLRGLVPMKARSARQ